ncbi:MAG: M14 family zinc carboxypeptidase, partial [Fidelibacterota bacterium]
MEIIRELNLPYEVLISDLEQFYQERFDYAMADRMGLGSMGGFFTFREVEEQLDSLYFHFPNIISKKFPIGFSVENNPIWAVKISDNPQLDEDEPEILFTSLTHAREPQGMMTVIHFMKYLVRNYGVDEEVTFLVNNREIWFIPVVNPDGYLYNEAIKPNGGGMWRKNKRDNDLSGHFNEDMDGVDLNRNFGKFWGYDNVGSSPDPSSNTYRGSSPFSEPETESLRKLCNSRFFKIALNYHSYGGLLILPYGYDEEAYPSEPDRSTYLDIAAELTGWNRYSYGNAFQTLRYLFNGGSDDWMYGEQEEKVKIFAMTPEVGWNSDGFWPATYRIIPIAEQNINSNLIACRFAGSLLQVSDYRVMADGRYLSPGEINQIVLEIKNRGLSETASSVKITLSTRNPHASIIRGTEFLNPILPGEISSNLSRPFSIYISRAAMNGENIKFTVTLEGEGLYTLPDSISLRVGRPVTLFEDDAEGGMNNWNAGLGWGITGDHYSSESHSFTDSPWGDYSNNRSNILLLNRVLDFSNLSGAELDFHSRWEIEAGWDYAQIQASKNMGGYWKPLKGKFSRRGSGRGVQAQGEPGYDGFQLNWVGDRIDMDAFTGNESVTLRFILKTDRGVTEDGWYLDDIKILGWVEKLISPPVISNTTVLSNTSDTTGPYVVSSFVTDDSRVDSVTLFYTSSSVAPGFIPVGMVGDSSIYSGEIAGQPLGSKVGYYIHALDDSGESSLDPADAPFKLYKFEIIRKSPTILVSSDSLFFNARISRIHERLLKIYNKGEDTLQVNITDVPINEAIHLTAYPAHSGKLQEVIITDPVGDFFGGVRGIIYPDVVEIKAGLVRNFVTFQVVFDTLNSRDIVGVISIDEDQNFSTGQYPAAYGTAFPTQDIGSEYEIILDPGGNIFPVPGSYMFESGDTLSLPVAVGLIASDERTMTTTLLLPFKMRDINVSAVFASLDLL